MRKTVTADSPILVELFGVGIKPGRTKKAQRLARKAYLCRLKRAAARGQLPPVLRAGKTMFWWEDEVEAKLESQRKKERAS